MAVGEFRLRLCYTKGGRLRYLSHLEVVRALERSARRSGMPYAVTQGYVPRMKAAFGPALPVGTAGNREYLDVWLTRYVPAEQLLGSLRSCSPEDLMPTEARYVPERLPSLSAACTVGVYEVVVAGEDVSVEAVEAALVALRAEGRLAVRHKDKQKDYDLASCLPKEPRARSEGDTVVVDIATRMGPDGSLRPDVFVREALARSGTPGAVRHVTRLDALIDEDGELLRPI